LKLWRKRWSITQVGLAKMLGTYQVTIARWETGVRKIPFLLPLALEGLENRMEEGGGKDDFTSKGAETPEGTREG